MASYFRCCFIVLASLLCCVQVNASTRTIIIEPSGLQRIPQGNPGGVSINTQWPANVNVPGAPGSGKLPVPVSKSAQHGWPAIRNAAKGLMKIHPGRAAATAGVMAVMTLIDWEYDQDSDTWKRSRAGEICYHAYYGGQGIALPCEYANSGDACRALYAASNTAYKSAGALTSGACYYNHPTQVPSLIQSGRWGQATVTSSQKVPVIDSDFDDFVSHFNDPSQVVPDVIPTILEVDPSLLGQPDSVVFTGPESVPGQPTHTTTLDNVSGNTTVVESTPTHHFQYGSDPLSVTSHTTTITNTYVNGQQTSSTSTSNQTQNPVTSPVATETPTDCAFMPTVCAFIDWVKTPFNEQAPDFADFIENEDFEREFNMPATGTCPPPLVLNTSYGSFEFSWEPGCYWAGLIKPFIIIAALISAILINLGAFRSN